MINQDELEKIVDKVIDCQEEEYEVQTNKGNAQIEDLLEEGGIENVSDENKEA